jgi:hypothetical protein
MNEPSFVMECLCRADDFPAAFEIYQSSDRALWQLQHEKEELCFPLTNRLDLANREPP